MPMEEEIMNKMRQSNMELLRIFSMVIIVLSHYVYHGGLLGQELSINQAFAQFLKMGGKLGVTCFVLISAYYLIESRFKIQNIFKLMLQISFYAVSLIGIKFVMTGSASVTEIFKSILAPIYNVYWFPTTYIGMYLVFPLMNIIVNKYNENCLKLVIFLTVPFSIVHFLFVGSDFLYSNLTWFLYLYLWGGVLRNCCLQRMEQRSCAIAIGSACLIWASSMCMTFLGLKTGKDIILSHASYFTDITSPLIIVCAVGIFLTFKKMDVGYNKKINSVAKLAFPVYLLHDNPFFRKLFWSAIVRTEDFYEVNIFFLILHMLMVVVALFVAAAILESIRKKIETILFELNIFNKVKQIDALYNIN